MTEFNIVIPARLNSQRLPRKLLADLAGRTVIEHTWEKANLAGATHVLIATDSDEIEEAARTFGAEVIITSDKPVNGTERVAEAIRSLNWDPATIVVNLQADEPLIDPQQLALAAEAVLDADVGTLCAKIRDVNQISDLSVVKVVRDADDRALYFSRSPIPAVRDEMRIDVEQYRRHIGVYAYRVDALHRLSELPACPLEQVESLEQLRALYHGLVVRVVDCTSDVSLGIDTPDDLAAARRALGVSA